jgi:hypothetical protein
MKRIILLAATAICLFSCSSTKLISSWKASGASVNKYDKVLVIAITGSKDREIRQSVEQAMAQRLQEAGITAVTAMDQYGPKKFDKMSEDAAVKMVNDNGFDAVMVIGLVDKSNERNYTPGYATNTPIAVVRGRWYPYYSVLYDRTYTPGYYTTSTNYTLEANFYATKGDKLEYSAQAKSFDPGSASTLASDFSKTVVEDMKKKAVVAG